MEQTVQFEMCKKRVEMDSGVVATNAVCDRTDCPSYGKWWCPFTGW